jgi:hypothetical protein
MECPYLSGNYLLSCKADFALHIPSSLELNELCTTGKHSACPFYFSSDCAPRENTGAQGSGVQDRPFDEGKRENR